MFLISMLRGLIFKHQVSVSCKTYIGLLVNGKKGHCLLKLFGLPLKLQQGKLTVWYSGRRVKDFCCNSRGISQSLDLSQQHLPVNLFINRYLVRLSYPSLKNVMLSSHSYALLSVENGIT